MGGGTFSRETRSSEKVNYIIVRGLAVYRGCYFEESAYPTDLLMLFPCAWSSTRHSGMLIADLGPDQPYEGANPLTGKVRDCIIIATAVALCPNSCWYRQTSDDT